LYGSANYKAILDRKPAVTVVAQVLAACTGYWTEAVLVAADLALESGKPVGNINPERAGARLKDHTLATNLGELWRDSASAFKAAR
jgi:hypothetical protein